MNDNEWDQWKDWMDDQKTALGNPSPHIFTYALGNGADETIPAQLACENDGWFAKVEDGDPAALKHAMIRYFEYFSDKIPLVDSKRFFPTRETKRLEAFLNFHPSR